MLERLIPPLNARPALRRSIEWFVIAYAVIMPVALVISDGMRCVYGGCRQADDIDAVLASIKDSFSPENLPWHLTHAAMIAVTVGVYAYFLNKAHRREQSLLLQGIGRYHEAIDNLESGFYRTTLDGRFLMANTALASMLGYESLDELTKTPVSSLYPASGGRDRFIAKLRETGHLHQFEVLVVKKDGTPLLVSEDAHLVGDTITGVISVVERSIGRNIIVVCAYCNMMRDGDNDDAPWVGPPTYLNKHMKEIRDPLWEIDFSHGMCPRCVQREFPGVVPAPAQAR